MRSLYAGDIQVDTRGEKELSEVLSGLNIRELVRPGQQILVQVIKESGGTKGFTRLEPHYARGTAARINPDALRRRFAQDYRPGGARPAARLRGITA